MPLPTGHTSPPLPLPAYRRALRPKSIPGYSRFQRSSLFFANKVVIDLNRAHFRDISAVAALDKVVIRFRRKVTAAEVRGLNQASATIVDRFGIHDTPEDIDRIPGDH